MSNNIFLFRLYILIMLFFLVPLSYIITLQVYNLLRRYVFLNSVINTINTDKQSSQLYKEYDDLFDLLLDSKNIFLCISFAELLIKRTSIDTHIIYILLAYSYQKSDFFYVSEYYYLKSNRITSNNLIVLLGLANVYKSLGKINELDYVKSQINRINSNYTQV